MHQIIDIEALCAQRGLRITDQRRVIARVLSESDDHPDVEKLHERAVAVDPRISIATVYRTVRLFEEAGILDRHDFGDGRSRYEAAPEAHHDHLIDVESGKVIGIWTLKVLHGSMVEVPDAGSDFIDDIVVMRDYEHRSFVLLQGDVQGVDRFQIQVIGWLVKHQKVRLLQHQPAE